MALSSLLFVVWWILGTSATLAWFSDVDTIRNEFRIGNLNLDVAYKNDIVDIYTPMYSTSEVFIDEALYEPGFTQVVYLEIVNNGNVDFNYKVAVTVDPDKVTKGRNAWGKEIYLPNYLRYGVVFAESEEELEQQLKSRLVARSHATSEWGALGTWSEDSPYTFEVGEEPHYAALVVYMPESVGNAANYRGITQPSVALGVTVFAQQAGTPMPKE